MKDLIVKDNKGNVACSIKYIVEKDEIDITLNKPINLKLNGDFGFEINGDVDWSVYGDMRIDTFLSCLHLNSYLSKYIKDHPKSIEKRKEIEKRLEKYDEWLEENNEKIIEYAKQFLNERLTRIDKI